MMKSILVADDLRHIIDTPTLVTTPVKALKLISKIETKVEMKSLKERIDNLESFKIDGVSALQTENVVKSSRPTMARMVKNGRHFKLVRWANI